jgi:hypothetical protein
VGDLSDRVPTWKAQNPELKSQCKKKEKEEKEEKEEQEE